MKPLTQQYKDILNFFDFKPFVDPDSSNIIYTKPYPMSNPYINGYFPLTVIFHGRELNDFEISFLDSACNQERYSRISSQNSVNRADYLIKDLILNSFRYEQQALAYHIQRICRLFNTIDFKIIEDKGIEHAKLIKVKKYYEKGYSGGIDKDNSFLMFLDEYYILTLAGNLFMDDYLRSIIPQNKTTCVDGYEAYKPQHSATPDSYSIEFCELEFQSFMSLYSYERHSEYLENL